MRLASFILTTLVFVTSCSTEPKSASSEASSPVLEAASNTGTSSPSLPPDTGEPALHAVQNDRLQQAMTQLNAIAYTQMITEVDLSKESRLRTDEVAKIARQLSANQTAILQSIPTLNLSPSEAATFTALANKLRDSADRMETLAKENQIQAIPAALDTITSTCNSCHTLFRKSRSILERCRDPKATC